MDRLDSFERHTSTDYAPRAIAAYAVRVRFSIRCQTTKKGASRQYRLVLPRDLSPTLAEHIAGLSDAIEAERNWNTADVPVRTRTESYTIPKFSYLKDHGQLSVNVNRDTRLHESLAAMEARGLLPSQRAREAKKQGCAAPDGDILGRLIVRDGIVIGVEVDI